MVWTLVEPGIAIIAASLVTIRPLLRLLKLRGFGSTDRTFGYNSGTARSGTQFSRGRMPGYGRGDVKMTDIETGTKSSHTPAPEFPASAVRPGKARVPPHMSPLTMSPFNPSAAGQPPVFGDGETQPRRPGVTVRRTEPESDENGFLPAPGRTRRWRDEVTSDVYVIQGETEDQSRMQGRRSRSPSLSSIDMIGMEAHCHHYDYQNGGKGMI